MGKYSGIVNSKNQSDKPENNIASKPESSIRRYGQSKYQSA